MHIDCHLRQRSQWWSKRTAVGLTVHPNLQNYGGEVEVLVVEGGKCTVRYTGPAPIGMGVRAAIKDKFPDITEVQLVD